MRGKPSINLSFGLQNIGKKKINDIQTGLLQQPKKCWFVLIDKRSRIPGCDFITQRKTSLVRNAWTQECLSYSDIKFRLLANFKVVLEQKL